MDTMWTAAVSGTDVSAEHIVQPRIREAANQWLRWTSRGTELEGDAAQSVAMDVKDAQAGEHEVQEGHGGRTAQPGDEAK